MLAYHLSYLFMQVNLFPYEDYQVQELFYHDWGSFVSLLEAGYQQLLFGLCNPGWLHSV